MKPKKTISSYLQKQHRDRISTGYSTLFFAVVLSAFLLPGFISAQVIRKTEVSFIAADGLEVTANLYQSKKSNPYIILLHQEESCKGEFETVINRFVKMNFNCLAVDLRSGNDVGFEKNKTAAAARQAGISQSLKMAEQDIEAAIAYVYKISTKNISLLGSAGSATLALLTGRMNENVNAVVALSPGNYLAPENSLDNILSNYPKPVFVASTVKEYPYYTGIEGFPGNNKILFKPSDGDGMRGTKALLKENPSRDQYWLSLLLFFKALK